MSPEQARGVSDLDHRSDLWSLAVIAFECVTGRLPFDSTSLGDLFAKILFEPIPVPSDVAPDSAPRTLDRWWTHAASRAVEDRYTSAIELADALGRALGVVKDEVRETLRARSWEGSMVVARPSATPGLPRRRLSKVVVAAIALVIAPIALMVTSGRIDARTARALGASHAALTAAAAPASAVSAAATPSVPAVTVAPPSLPVAPTRIADTHTVAAYRAPSRAQAASVMDAPAMAAGLAASITNGISAASSIKDDSPPALPAPLPAPGVGSHPRPASSPDDSDFGI
jgi:serine/threonine-protein kinase